MNNERWNLWNFETMADIILLRIIKDTLQESLDMCKYDVLASEIRIGGIMFDIGEDKQ
jgi:hypothetical protein